MRCILALTSCLIAGCLGSFPNPGQTHMASRKVPEIALHGGCITPAAPSESVRLDLMQVVIRQKRDSYSVDALFHLFNTGETTTETVGIPKYGTTDENWGTVAPWRAAEPRVCDFLRFDAWIDGQKTEFAEARRFYRDPSARPIGGYRKYPWGKRSDTRWMVKEVTFAGKATTIIRVRFEARYRNLVAGANPFDDGFYHSWTGRYWKDKIRKATFVMDTTDIGEERGGPGSDMSPAARRPTRTINRVEMRNYEPPVGTGIGILGTSVGALRKQNPDRLLPKSCSH